MNSQYSSPLTTRQSHRKIWLPFVLVFILLLTACDPTSLIPGGDEPAAPVEQEQPAEAPAVEQLSSPEETAEEAPQEEAQEETPPADSEETTGEAESIEPIEDQSELLVDRVWVLVGYGEALNPTVVEEGTVVTAIFSNDGTVSGSAGCNNYSLNYELGEENSLLTRGPIAATQMACPTGGDQETAYLTALQQAQSYFINEEGRLEVTYDSGAMYEEKLIYAPGQTPLTNTRWILHSFGDATNLQSVESNTTITAIFIQDEDEDDDELSGTVNGSAGCNGYSAAYTLNEGQISITAPASTRKFCPTGMEQEQAYLTALQSAQSYRIIGKRLEITYEGGVLIFSSANLPLENILWTLVSAGSLGAVEPVPEKVEITALFEPDTDDEDAVDGDTESEDADGTVDEEDEDEESEEETKADSTGDVSGSAGCNNYSAVYEVEGIELRLGPPISTRKFCAGIMQIEGDYLEAIESAGNFNIIGDQLEITYDEGDEVLNFVANRTPLEETLWQLVSYGPTEQPQSPVEDAEFTARFNREGDAPSGIVEGSTGCNDYNATYTANLSEIKINLPRKTQNFCGDAAAEMEQAYFLGLNAARNYRILGDTLQIPYDNGRLMLTFVAVPPPVEPVVDLSPLRDTQWWLVSLADRAVLAGTEITAEFTINDDNVSGVVSGFSGCNNYNAAINPGFNIGPMAVTKKACQLPEGVTEQEQAYLKALQNASSYSIASNQLLISTAAGVLNFTNIQPDTARPPVAVINAPAQAEVGQLVTLDATASQSDLPITAYLWEFGDGGKANAIVVQHAYNTAGVYNVTLTVVDSAGQSNTAATQIQISEAVETPPTAVIEGPTEAFAGQEVTFQGGNSIPGSSPIVVYGWDFGKSRMDAYKNSSPDVVATTVYQEPGVYQVTLTVTDQNGLSDSASLEITILPLIEPTPTPVPTDEPAVLPQAVIIGPKEAEVNEAVVFDGTASQPGNGGAIVRYEWAFGDGGTAIGPVANHAYGNPGGVEVVLIITDERGQTNNTLQSILITQPEQPTPVPTPEPPPTPVQPTVEPPKPVQPTVEPQPPKPVQPTAGPPGQEVDTWVLNNSLPQATVTLVFKNGQFGGKSGCNNYAGTYQVDGNNLALRLGQQTQIFCEEEIMTQENAYLSALQNTTSFQVEGNQLTLFGADTLTFTAQ